MMKYDEMAPKTVGRVGLVGSFELQLQPFFSLPRYGFCKTSKEICLGNFATSFFENVLLLRLHVHCDSRSYPFAVSVFWSFFVEVFFCHLLSF